MDVTKLLGGMNPYLLGAGIAMPFLGSFLQSRSKEQKQYNEMYNQYQDPTFLYNRTSQYLPMMRQAVQGRLGALGAGALGFQNTLNRNLTRSGLNRTGLGAMSASLGAGVYAGEVGDAYGQAYENAMGAAYKDRDVLGQLLSQGPRQNIWASALGGATNNVMGMYMANQMYKKG